MLKELVAENFALVNDVQAHFDSGLSILSGETGAGKSILIDALEMGLGKRARSGLIGPNSNKFRISLCFDISQIEVAQQWLNNYELANDDEDTCILRRTYNTDKRSQSYINGVPVTLNQLKEIGTLIIDVVGQNTQQQLLNKTHQLWLLDIRCGHTQKVKELESIYRQWMLINQQIDELKESLSERKIKISVLEQQIDELESSNISEGEYEEIESLHRKLAQGEKFKNSLSSAYEYLDGEDESIIKSLGSVIRIIESISTDDKQMQTIGETLNNALIQLDEATNELRNTLAQMQSDEQSFKTLEQRLRELSDLAKRYYVQPQMLNDFLVKAKAQLAQLNDSELNIESLEKECNQVEQDYQSLAAIISTQRHKIAKEIKKDTDATLKKLNMGQAKFEVSITKQDTPTHNGYDYIEFLIQTNPGFDEQPLSSVSGGELSRISLALQMVLSKWRTTPVLVFDEVDAGVGGATAEAVGKLLKSISLNAQVFCITHLAQVASQATHHYQVKKETSKNSTQIQITLLDKKQRCHEIARMMAGTEITDQSLKYAQEMIDNAELLS